MWLSCRIVTVSPYDVTTLLFVREADCHCYVDIETDTVHGAISFCNIAQEEMKTKRILVGSTIQDFVIYTYELWCAVRALYVSLCRSYPYSSLGHTFKVVACVTVKVAAAILQARLRKVFMTMMELPLFTLRNIYQAVKDKGENGGHR
jgi:hypothetical protein